MRSEGGRGGEVDRRKERRRKQSGKRWQKGNARRGGRGSKEKGARRNREKVGACQMKDKRCPSSDGFQGVLDFLKPRLFPKQETKGIDEERAAL